MRRDEETEIKIFDPRYNQEKREVMTDQLRQRERFLVARNRVAARIAAVQGDERRETRDDQTDTAHLWEDADIRDADLDQLIDELNEIDAALQRLDLGSYGVCESCGQPIPDDRLEAMPFATTCVECAEA